MPVATKEELQERAQLVRVHEANCTIEHPSTHELNFRLAIMKKIGTSFGLPEMRAKEITGPAQTPAYPLPNPAAQAAAAARGKGAK